MSKVASAKGLFSVLGEMRERPQQTKFPYDRAATIVYFKILASSMSHLLSQDLSPRPHSLSIAPPLLPKKEGAPGWRHGPLQTGCTLSVGQCVHSTNATASGRESILPCTPPFLAFLGTSSEMQSTGRHHVKQRLALQQVYEYEKLCICLGDLPLQVALRAPMQRPLHVGLQPRRHSEDSPMSTHR